MSDELKAREPIVLDAEGHVLHDPSRPTTAHGKTEFKTVNLSKVGLVPKILIAGGFFALLLLGLTVAGVALGVILVTYFARTLFKPKRR